MENPIENNTNETETMETQINVFPISIEVFRKFKELTNHFNSLINLDKDTKRNAKLQAFLDELNQIYKEGEYSVFIADNNYKNICNAIYNNREQLKEVRDDWTNQKNADDWNDADDSIRTCQDVVYELEELDAVCSKITKFIELFDTEESEGIVLSADKLQIKELGDSIDMWEDDISNLKSNAENMESTLQEFYDAGEKLEDKYEDCGSMTLDSIETEEQ